MRAVLAAAHHLATQGVVVIVVMGVHGNVFGNLSSEQLQVFRVLANVLGVSLATDVLVETDHGIRSGHHQMQVM